MICLVMNWQLMETLSTGLFSNELAILDSAIKE